MMTLAELYKKTYAENVAPVVDLENPQLMHKDLDELCGLGFTNRLKSYFYSDHSKPKARIQNLINTIANAHLNASCINKFLQALADYFTAIKQQQFIPLIDAAKKKGYLTPEATI